jgi:hypothetical protein
VAAIDLTEPWAKRIIQIATPRGRTQSPAAMALVKQLVSGPADAASSGAMPPSQG